MLIVLGHHGGAGDSQLDLNLARSDKDECDLWVLTDLVRADHKVLARADLVSYGGGLQDSDEADQSTNMSKRTANVTKAKPRLRRAVWSQGTLTPVTLPN